MEFKYTLLLVCFIFVLFLIYKEVKRVNKARLLWRIIASVVMVGAFAALVLPVTYTVKKVETTNALNLITVGATKENISMIKGKSYTLDLQ